MQNKAKLILLGLIFTVSCQQEEKSFLSLHMQTKSQETPVVARKLASDPNVCLSDLFSVETLKAEVLAEEKEFSGNPVWGNWRHINFLNLPIPQANFLKKYGDKIGDLANDSVDYAGCTDVPCIINRIYGKEEHIAGYVHYLWYLRMGHMLSADNLVPALNMDNNPRNQIIPIPGQYKGRSFPLSSFLYSENELYGFWRLSLMVQTPYSAMGVMDEMQRLPRGEKFDNSSTCGMAHSGGFILLADSCLNFGMSKDEGFFYEAVTHEMAHQIDFEEGYKVYGASYRSHQADYLALSGFSLEEYRDATGKVSKTWKHETGIKLINSYAGTSPQENFAELLSHFRHNGDKTMGILNTDHYQFGSREYFQDKEYTRKILFEQWVKEETSKSSKDSLKAVIDCLFSPHIQHCIDLQTESLVKTISGRVKATRPEACKLMAGAPNKNLWETSTRAKVVSDFARFQNFNRDTLVKLEDNFEIIADSRYAYDNFLKCVSADKECYEAGVKVTLGQQFESLNLEDSERTELVTIYLSKYPFEEIQAEANKFYKTIINSNLSKISKKVDTMWDACIRQGIRDRDVPRPGPFVISEGYMPSSIYNCINAGIPGVVNATLTNLGYKGLTLDQENEKAHIRKLIEPTVLSQLNTKYLMQKQKEINQAKLFIEQRGDDLRSILLSNKYWSRNKRGKAAVEDACRLEALRIIGVDPVYHLKKDLFGEFIDRNVCYNIFEQL